MSALAPTPPSVSPAEIARRVAEYRRLSLERQAPAQVVYHPEHHPCPWAGCDFRIAGIHFCLEAQGDAAQQAQWRTAWWSGPGLVARCPRCQRSVLFGLEGKRAVADPAPWATSLLPEAWHTKARLVKAND